MKKITKQKWVNALRSGKFEQGSGRLCEGGKYCCLGVLAKITGNLTEEKNSKTNYHDNIGYGRNGNVYNRYLMCSTDGESRLLTMKSQDSLVTMNDVRAMSFSEIADWIEKNIKTED